MKMKRELTFVQMGLSVLMVIFWFLFPIFSFSTGIPLVPALNISGWNLCININQLMFIPLALSMIMLVAAVLNERIMMIVSGLLQVVCAVLIIIFKKDILLGGNLKLLNTFIELLVSKIPEGFEILGVPITSGNVQDIIEIIINNLQLGLGFILFAVCVLTYIMIACVGPAKTQSAFSAGIPTGGTGAAGTQTGTSTFTPNNKTGYKHRT